MTGDDNNTHRDLLLRRQAALAEFGRKALTTDDLDLLLHEGAALAAQGLGTHHAKVMERLPDGSMLLLRAGIGWKPGTVGRMTLDAGHHSAAGYTLVSGLPLHSEDLATETRFEIPSLLSEHGIRSLVNVIIQGKGPAFGVLEVDSTEPNHFDQEDIAFLQSYANLLAAAIERRQAQEALIQAGRAAARLAEERRLLLRELQHRVKNNLQVISSLLNLQTRRTRNEEVLRQLKIIGSRVETLRVVHDALYAEQCFDRIALAGYMQDLCHSLFAFHGGEAQGAMLKIEMAELDAPVDAAVPLGLLVNEFITNSLRHAFPSGQGGTVTVKLEAADERNGRLILADDGIGMPDPKPSETGTGLLIMQVLAAQLGGRLNWEKDSGTRARLEFPRA